MARSRGSVQKRNTPPDTRRLTRREKLHQLRADAGNASTYNHRNHFEPLTRVNDRRSRCFARRRRARYHKRKELLEFQLATLDAELSSRVDDVIRANKHTSNVQLPELHASPMQMVKWEPSAFLPVNTPTSRFQPVSDADWSNLEILFSHQLKKAALGPLPSPPTSLMIAAELGLFTPSPPRVHLPELTNNCRIATPSVKATVVAPRTSKSLFTPLIDLNSVRLNTSEYDNDTPTSFVAAKLPQFREIDPYDLTTDLTFEAKPTESGNPNHKPQSTRCTFSHEGLEDDLEEQVLDSFQSLRECEERRVSALAQDDSSGDKTNNTEMNWADQPVMDWPYDALGDWNNDPVLDWDGNPATDWTDEPIVGWSDEAVMIEHDAETYDWTFLSSEDKAPNNSISILSSAFSSMEVLPLPLRDSFLDKPSAYEEPVHNLEGDHSNMRRVSRSAWESESDFCIPAFF